MSRIRKYRVIEQKLGQLPGPHMNALWADMKARLDQKLPEDKERKRMFWWWKVSGLFLVVPAAVFTFAIIFSISVSKDKNPVETEHIPQHAVTSSQAESPMSSSGVTEVGSRKKSDPAASETGIGIARLEKSKVKSKISKTAAAPISHHHISHQRSNNSRSGSAADNRALPVTFLFTATQNILADSTFLNKEPERVGERLYASSLQPMIQPKQLSFILMYPSRGFTSNFEMPAALSAQAHNTGHTKIRVGIAINLNLPVSSQEMSTVSVNGGNNKLVDYLPSLYGQYHFHKKMFVQTEFQFIAPQHTPELLLENNIRETGPNRRQEHSVQLNKLYYMNIPVSVHYRVLPHLYVGAGIQYSYLTRSILTEESATWQISSNGWEKKTSLATVHIKKNPKKEKEMFKTNNSNNPNLPRMTEIDVVAQKFRSNDWRFTYDINYNRGRFNAGIRMNVGINNYIQTEVGNTRMPVQDRNKSIQAYIRYQIREWKK